MEENYPEGTPGIDIVAELKKLQDNVSSATMSLVFGRMSWETDAMIKQFKNRGIHIDDVDMNDTMKVASVVTKGVRNSIFKTLTFSQGQAKSLILQPISEEAASISDKLFPESMTVRTRRYSIMDSSANEWKIRQAKTVDVYKNQKINSVDHLKAPFQCGIVQFKNKGSKTMLMKRTEEPFDEGESRVVYEARLGKHLNLLNLPNAKIVAKAFKNIGGGCNTFREYKAPMDNATAAMFLAEEYNESSYRPAHCARIEYLEVSIVEELHTASNKMNEDESTRFNTEPLLPQGAFTKFNNNVGNWQEEHLDESLLRFTVFAYETTGGYLVVADLQGVKKGNIFTLTDPAVICQDPLRFGDSNLGGAFVEKCIESTRALMKENSWE